MNSGERAERTMQVSYEIFQRLIAHLQSAVKELEKQIEHVGDEKEQREWLDFIASANKLVDEALHDAK